MRMMSVLVVSAIAGTVVPMANAQKVQLSSLEAGQQLEPLRVAKARMIDGQAVRIGEWHEYRTGAVRGNLVPYFDLYEADEQSTPPGLPTGFCEGGCGAVNPGCPSTAPSSRWWFGAAYNNPFHINDMTVAPNAHGAEATMSRFTWGWGPLVPTQCIVAVFTAETFVDCLTGPPGSASEYDGIIYDYGFQTGGGGYFWASNDLSPFPGLFHQMPMDGSGAYLIILANAEDPITGALTVDLTPGTQPMLWGTGDHESPPDGRVGTHGPEGWDDDFPANGMHDLGECYDQTAPSICPGVVAGMIMFLGEATTPSCYANCDGSTQQPVLNVADFTCFLTKFAQQDPYANCDGSTTPPVLNVADFTCFLTKFAAGC
jgi:hypothetical protein